MATLSLCMIVKNEEDTLGRCLDSVAEAMDEIIVADTGSSDKTVEIARARGAKVFFFRWRDDFAAARNFSFSKAGCDYVMWLDADDAMTPEELKKLIRLKAKLAPPVRVVAARYDAGFDESGKPVLSYFRERIFLREAGLRWEGEVHETIPLPPDTLYADFAVQHLKNRPSEPGRNLRIYEKLLAAGRTLSPRQQYYYARELYENGRYADSARHFSSFLKTGAGWLPDRVGASVLRSRCLAALGQQNQALNAALAGLAFGAPNSELCCEIGQRFFDAGDYPAAVYWYEQALLRAGQSCAGFVYPDCEGYIPLLQLCVLYDRLGDIPRAISCNERAAAIRPDSPAAAFNRAYFESRQAQPDRSLHNNE